MIVPVALLKMRTSQEGPPEETLKDGKPGGKEEPNIQVSPPPDKAATTPYMDPATRRPIPIQHTARPVEDYDAMATAALKKTAPQKARTLDGHLSPEVIDDAIARKDSRLPSEEELRQRN